MHQCYAVGRTADGEELRCCLARDHRDKSDHWDSIRDEYWSVDLVTNPWALAGARG